ncbi:MAG TPA: glycosyltransferase family 39 protein [Pirellulales bacterium]|nr:glycosyltransferase family 39 protein [Pirellulales bacterium]
MFLSSFARLLRSRLPGWLEPQAVLLVLIVAAIYFARLDDLTLRGEETRRARVAIEMLETGDWVVPREQGRVFPDRPPLGNWLIALSMLATGGSGTLAVRLPTVLATLATTLIIYGYSRTALTRNGALAAGLAYATMGQVLQLGMLAETEATMTLLVGASLLLWHRAYRGGLPARQTWCLGYALSGLAALAKGPQGPIYFVAATVVYLAVRRDWRFLLSWSHLTGIIAGTAVVAVWQVPYSMAVEWKLVLQTWGHTSAARFDYSSLGPVFRHLLAFPCEIFGCLLPWSVWLAAFASRDFRRGLAGASDMAVFLGIAIAVAFPTCWLAPQARGRYFMPLYPCFAPLVAIAVERAWSRAATRTLAKLWQRYLSLAAAGAAIAAVAVLAASLSPWLAATPLHQSPAFAVCYSLGALAAAAVAWQTRRPESGRQAVAGVAAVAVFLGLTSNGLLMNDVIRRSEDIAGQVAQLKQRLPDGVPLVSLGRAHHPFVYHYGQTIPWLDWPKPGGPTDYEYFCFHCVRGRRKPLPFEWEEIGVVRCDRYRRMQPVDAMVIGRRRPQITKRHDRPRVR